MKVSKIEWSDPAFVSQTVKKVGKVYTSVGFVVDGIKIVHGSKGLFVAMPSRKDNEEWKDVCYIMDKETREIFNEEVLSSYHGIEDQTPEAGEDVDQTPAKGEKDENGNWENWGEL